MLFYRGMLWEVVFPETKGQHNWLLYLLIPLETHSICQCAPPLADSTRKGELIS